MKKLALLTVLALVISISCVFATDLDNAGSEPVVNSVETPDAGASAPSGEIDLITDLLSGEDSLLNLSGENNEDESGENNETTDAPTQEDTNTPSVEVNDDAVENSSDNSAMIGAILAIVIVIAVVAIAAILRKD